MLSVDPVDVAGYRRGIECRIGKARIVIPTAVVKEAIEYDVLRPPAHVHRLVSGLAVHDARVLVSLALVPSADGGRDQRRTKGVLLTLDRHAATGGGNEVLWAIEVTELLTLVQCQVLPKRGDEAPGTLPPWVYRATTRDARLTAWIDVVGLLAELGLAISEGS